MPSAIEARGRVLRLALLADYAEEGWPSMELCGEMLLHGLRARPARVAPALLRPHFAGRCARLPLLGSAGGARNLDRLLGRFVDYPRWVRERVGEFEAFHVVDHSYAALLHALPAERSGVYCHDLDAFRCLIEPARDPRPRWFRALARRVLSGLQRAAVVFHSTRAVREELLRHGLVEAERLVHAPLGVAPEMSPHGPLRAVDVAPALAGRPFVLHVGSTIPRKRVDVLLRAYAAARGACPGLALVQAGGAWSDSQRRLLLDLGLGEDAVVQVRGLGRDALAALYRAARVLLLPSEAEGFGLPVLEALACGTPVVASDLPVLREVGGDVVRYVPAGSGEAWTEALRQAVAGEEQPGEMARRLAHAAEFTWDRHAERILEAYERLG